MRVLGIETSCDETAAAVVADDGTIFSNCVRSQTEEHAAFGGVVPEVAARAHSVHLPALIEQALKEANCTIADIDAVAATCGPGLIGGVMVGMMMGKAIAAARGIAFVPVNHLEAHALTARLTDKVAFPYVLLLVSGGHTQILVAKDVGDYTLLGQTLDDAAGECLDKAAKVMGLPQPGGPQIERLAAQALDCGPYKLPRPLRGRKGCDFSFSGLKTAVRLAAQKLPQDSAIMAPLAKALEEAIADVLSDRCAHAIAMTGIKTLVAAGGVAANGAVRRALAALPCTFYAPPPALCGDNAAMVAWAGIERLQKRLLGEGLAAKARPRWPLDKES